MLVHAVRELVLKKLTLWKTIPPKSIWIRARPWTYMKALTSTRAVLGTLENHRSIVWALIVH